MNEKTEKFLKIYDEYQPFYDEFDDEIERILAKLYGYSKRNIGEKNWSFGKDIVYVSFEYVSCGYTDNEYEEIPLRLFFESNEVIDKYIAEKAEESRKLAEKKEKERRKQEEKKEREQLKYLMDKYGE